MISKSTVKKYCCEDISLIENYDKAINDPSQTWDCHHRRETVYTADELIEIGEYYNRPAVELIFMTKADHNSMHFKGISKQFTEEHCNKISIKAKDRLSNPENHPMYGRNQSDDAKMKIGKANKGNKNAAKKVMQYSKNGEFIREWSSANEAAKYVKSSKVGEVCNGYRKYAGGYIWKWSE